MTHGAERAAGLALGYARPRRGRLYHIVEVRQYPHPIGLDAEGRSIFQERTRVERAICGFQPVDWYPPVDAEPARLALHGRCRVVLQETERLEQQRVEHVVGATA